MYIFIYIYIGHILWHHGDTLTSLPAHLCRCWVLQPRRNLRHQGNLSTSGWCRAGCSQDRKNHTGQHIWILQFYHYLERAPSLTSLRVIWDYPIVYRGWDLLLGKSYNMAFEWFKRPLTRNDHAHLRLASVTIPSTGTTMNNLGIFLAKTALKGFASSTFLMSLLDLLS